MPLTAAAVRTPVSLKQEHDQLHAELAVVAAEPGRIGAAAQEVANLLHPHFAREEALALSPLGLLPILATGHVSPDMKPMMEVAQRLEEELPRMLSEHISIVAAVKTLLDQANELGRPDVADFARKLILHAETEEDVLYPAAILVGKYLAARI